MRVSLWRRRAGRVLAACGGLAVALGAAELALRAFGLPTGGTEGLRFEVQQVGRVPTVYPADPELLWVNPAYAGRLQAARARRPWVIFMGDSCTELGGYPKAFVTRLSAARGPEPIVWLNAGTSGWSSYQGLTQFRRDLAPLRAPLVTVYYGWNDHWIGVGLEDREVAAGRGARGGRSGSRLVELGARALSLVRRGRTAPRRVPLDQYRDNLRSLCAEIRSGGGVPVLLTAPSSHEAGAEPKLLRGKWVRELSDLIPLHAAYVDATREVARSEGVALCDLAEAAARLDTGVRRAMFEADGIHPNRKGAPWVANLLYDRLEAEGLLDRIRPPDR